MGGEDSMGRRVHPKRRSVSTRDVLTSIFTFFYFGEIRNLTTFTRLMDYNNGFSLSFFFNLFLSFLWIGAQFPQEKFLSYGRILTLDYYFLLMCILFSYIYIFFLSQPRFFIICDLSQNS